MCLFERGVINIALAAVVLGFISKNTDDCRRPVRHSSATRLDYVSHTSIGHVKEIDEIR
jgi:hypothetical protein